ncbi:hypothetical protein V5799_026444 [Amblyomma americanum]|uniref:Uncharacterized protein n=1 Tax=Amblyomma americanum TaxID=6943 RepID=A0AAQ4DIJ9_AMBAM
MYMSPTFIASADNMWRKERKPVGRAPSRQLPTVSAHLHRRQPAAGRLCHCAQHRYLPWRKCVSFTGGRVADLFQV